MECLDFPSECFNGNVLPLENDFTKGDHIFLLFPITKPNLLLLPCKLLYKFPPSFLLKEEVAKGCTISNPEAENLALIGFKMDNVRICVF